jgi:O-antigen/teichoic acid export membrane protein
VATREVVLKAFGLLGGFVLARLLTPRDFGIIAFGATLIAFGNLIANGGIGAQLIQGASEPTGDELGALQGISVAGSFGVFALVAAIGLPIGGRVGEIATVMASSLPLSALSAPNAIVAERRMLYGPSVRADIAQTVCYNALAIGLVLLGLGVWSLAIALVIGTVVGTATLIVSGPIGFVWPILSWTVSRRFLKFGVQFQAASVASLVRDQGLNLITASLGGLKVLGIWSLANRMLQAVGFVFVSLFRVSFPAVARLVESGEDPRESVQRALSISTVITGFAVVAIGGSAPVLVPVAFGNQWHAVVAVLPWAAAGLLVAGPVGTTAVSFLYARGEPRTVLNSVLAHSAAWYLVAVPLLPTLGAEALGIGWTFSCAVDVVVLGRALARHGIGMGSVSAPPALAAGIAGAAAWLIAQALAPTVPALALSLAAGQTAYLAIMVIIRPRQVMDVFRTIRRALRPEPG